MREKHVNATLDQTSQEIIVTREVVSKTSSPKGELMPIERAALSDESIPASRGVSIALEVVSKTLTPKGKQITIERAALSNGSMFDTSGDRHRT